MRYVLALTAIVPTPTDAIETEMHGDAFRIDADRGKLNADLIRL
jgi:hypothetical protein